MNIFKKKTQVRIFFDEKDFQQKNEILQKNLLELIQVTEGKEFRCKMKDIDDLPLNAFSILISFAKCLQDKDIPITIEAGSNLIDGMMEIGLGNLISSLETAKSMP
ncbi:MAG: hypothetical protein H7A23_11740 [Leptospiraceae bacterium]|nr:hypothetical protein [Leptospiraceae bacterium]MCP5495218.1 hypothetical protein [Leptospiraceae bacterium]